MSFVLRNRRGTGSGRVLPLASIANQPHAFDNKFVPGAGVGAISTSIRRALSRRAAVAR